MCVVLDYAIKMTFILDHEINPLYVNHYCYVKANNAIILSRMQNFHEILKQSSWFTSDLAFRYVKTHFNFLNLFIHWFLLKQNNKGGRQKRKKAIEIELH